jgi:hypothetical protein
VYNIHVVEEIRIRSRGRFTMTPNIEGVERELRVLSLNKLCVQRDVKSVGKAVSKASLEIIKSLGLDDADRINAFVGTLINGLLLLALEAMPRASLSRFIEAVLSTYTKLVVIDVASREHEVNVNVVKQANLHPHVKVLTKLLLAKELILMRIEQGYDYDYDNGVKLSTLARYAQEVLYSWSERLRITTSFDFRTIIKALEEKAPINQWVPLASIMKQEPSSKCDEKMKKIDRFRRNFIQHSGLHSCVTEVRAEPSKEAVVYRIRYSKKVLEDPVLRKEMYRAVSEGIVKV